MLNPFSFELVNRRSEFSCFRGLIGPWLAEGPRFLGFYVLHWLDAFPSISLQSFPITLLPGNPNNIKQPEINGCLNMAIEILS